MSVLNKKQLGEVVVPVVEKFFVNHILLLNCGLTSFRLFFNKEHIYEVPENIFDEFCLFEIEINKRYASLGAYFSRECERLEKEAYKKFEQTGKYIDKQYPEYIKVISLLAFEDRDVNEKYRNNLIVALIA